jgi:hypothetical protein
MKAVERESLAGRLLGGFGLRIARALWFAGIILLLSMLGLGLVLLSPLLLRELDKLATVDWSRLGAIGQAYGATSAILAMVALGGVAVSLFVQTRQVRAGQVQAVREAHQQLMFMQLENMPVYRPCWGPVDVPTIEANKQLTYMNLIINYLVMGYEMGIIPGREIRSAMADMFKGEIGRDYWKRARSAWVNAFERRKHGRRFLRIVDEEFQKAIAVGPPVPSRTYDDFDTWAAPFRGSNPARSPIPGILIAFAGGVIFDAVLRRRRHG